MQLLMPYGVAGLTLLSLRNGSVQSLGESLELTSVLESASG